MEDKNPDQTETPQQPERGTVAEPNTGADVPNDAKDPQPGAGSAETEQ